ncbi:MULTISPECIES: 4-hydroxy-2-oxovalerate aldolase [unclassified Janthinobacterium]|uniref:4-hydroxy-2-oxovalerate aldolase n=1 Tax=unclassified Janthinobacterium TaxID=2610881 RepID=UPI0018CB14D8|nr:4-hydroxy-2-oxovalerate aldolase [Janthinobacterium sp. CG_23.4]MDH6159378.1 4-hydroxy 2-oxovalerate aldolase [Janthinobacterium sp. CG_23.4]
MTKKKILISDPTLRDGNHAVRHQLSRDSFVSYCKAAEAAGVPIIEVGHGNGLGASSLLIGECLLSDAEIFEASRANLVNTRLAIHVIPGFCTIKSDLTKALEAGVDVFRIASHCTEADVTDRHIDFVRKAGKEAYGVLMMSHMATPAVLLEEARKMESYGAEAIVIMDSAGAYFPSDVKERVSTLVDGLSIPVGFHGHNNLGMAVINSVTAIEAGATILDGTIRGFGAGAGNTQLEVLVAVLDRLGYETGIDLYKILDAADIAERDFNPIAPSISPLSIVSGLAGVFSGFAKPVGRAAQDYNVDPRDIFFGLGKRNAVAGQESLIIEVARDLAAQNAAKRV